jgi:hypothetical protein
MAGSGKQNDANQEWWSANQEWLFISKEDMRKLIEANREAERILGSPDVESEEAGP